MTKAIKEKCLRIINRFFKIRQNYWEYYKLKRKQTASNAELEVLYVFCVGRQQKSIIANLFPEYEISYRYRISSLQNIKPQPGEILQAVLFFKKVIPENQLTMFLKQGIKVGRIVDGFINSIVSSSNLQLPNSYCIEYVTNEDNRSNLIELLNSLDLSQQKSLLNFSNELMNKLRINLNNSSLTKNLFTAPKILVIEHVAGECSDTDFILQQNIELINLACNENPGAQVYFKALSKNGVNEATLRSLMPKVTYVTHAVCMKEALLQVNRVYTVSSFTAVEALINDIKVTCTGAPFYAGWGLTDDRNLQSARLRQLSCNELFAVAFIYFPKYVNPNTNEIFSIEELSDYLLNSSNHQIEFAINSLQTQESRNCLFEFQNIAHLHRIKTLFKSSLKSDNNNLILLKGLLEIHFLQENWLAIIKLFESNPEISNPRNIKRLFISLLSVENSNSANGCIVYYLLKKQGLKWVKQNILSYLLANRHNPFGQIIFNECLADSPKDITLYQRITNYYFRNGEFYKALTHALQINSICTSNQFHTLIGEIWLHLENNQPHVLLKHSLQSDIKLLNYLARLEIKRSRYKEAEYILNLTPLSLTRSLPVMMERAELFSRIGKEYISITILSTLMEFGQKSEKLIVKLAGFYKVTDQKEKALDTLIAGMHFYPNHTEILYQLGEVYFSLQQYSKAEEFIMKVIDSSGIPLKESDIIRNEILLSRILSNRGKHQEAENRLLNRMKENPNNSALLYALGSVYSSARNLEKFIFVYKEIVNTIESSINKAESCPPELYLQLSKALDRLGEQFKSYEAFKQYCLLFEKTHDIEHDRELYALYEIERGNWYRSKVDNANAIKHYNLAKHYTQISKNVRRINHELSASGQLEILRASLTDLVENDPKNLMDKKQLAEFLIEYDLYSHQGIKQDQFDHLDRSTQEIIRFNPDSEIGWHLKATLLLMSAKYTEAIEHFNVALEKSPLNQAAHLGLAHGYECLYLWEKAIEHYEIVLTASENYCNNSISRALYHYITILKITGFFHESAKWHAKFVNLHRKAFPVNKGLNSIQNDHVLENLLLIFYGGPGDQLRESGFLPLLLTKTRNLTVACDWRVADLLSRTYPEITVIPFTQNTYGKTNSFESWIAANDKIPRPAGPGSINTEIYHRFNDFDAIATSKDLMQMVWERELPPTPTYLKLDNARIVKMKQLLSSTLVKTNRLKIGISWRTIRSYSYPARCNMPLHTLAPIFKLDGVDFINLQNQITADEIKTIQDEFKSNFFMLDELDIHNDQDSLACMLSELDLVICTATSIRDIASAVGTETWSFTVAPGALDLWRKGKHSEDVWYKNIVHYDLQTHGSKENVALKIANDLQKKLKSIQPSGINNEECLFQS